MIRAYIILLYSDFQIEKKLVDAENDLVTFTSELGLPNLDVTASVTLWKKQVQQFAQGVVKLPIRC